MDAIFGYVRHRVTAMIGGEEEQEEDTRWRMLEKRLENGLNKCLRSTGEGDFPVGLVCLAPHTRMKRTT